MLQKTIDTCHIAVPMKAISNRTVALLPCFGEVRFCRVGGRNWSIVLFLQLHHE